MSVARAGYLCLLGPPRARAFRTALAVPSACTHPPVPPNRTHGRADCLHLIHRAAHMPAACTRYAMKATRSTARTYSSRYHALSPGRVYPSCRACARTRPHTCASSIGVPTVQDRLVTPRLSFLHADKAYGRRLQLHNFQKTHEQVNKQIRLPL